MHIRLTQDDLCKKIPDRSDHGLRPLLRHSVLHLSDKSATADDLKQGANVAAVKVVMEPTMKVTIGLPTCRLDRAVR